MMEESPDFDSEDLTSYPSLAICVTSGKLFPFLSHFPSVRW